MNLEIKPVKPHTISEAEATEIQRHPTSAHAADEQTPIIFEIEKSEINSDAIGSLASSHYYTHQNNRVQDLADYLDKNPHIFILGIVDDNMKCVGIMTKRDFQDKVGTRFGRDLYSKRKIIDLASEARTFKIKKNIFTVAAKINDELASTSNVYYALRRNDETFYGIFSSKDMLVFLSSITQKEMDMAEKIQTNIIKNNMYVEDESYTAVGYSKMAQAIGGDYYNIIKYDSNRCLLVLCDVSGKGISASIVTGIIGGMFDTFNIKDGFKQFLVKMNRYIYRTFNLNKYITALIMNLDAHNGKVRIIDLGHCMAEGNFYLVRNNKFHIIRNRNYGIPIGLEEDIEVETDSLELNDGDRIIVCTDGLHDQFNENGEGFDVAKLEKLVLDNNDRKPQELQKLIVSEIKEWRNGQPAFDDMTFIIIDYRG